MAETIVRVPREQATTNAKLGCGFFARAFNLCDDAEIPYCWPKQTRDEVERLLTRLVHLAEGGPIRPRAGAQAQDDAAFQRFMTTVHSDCRTWGIRTGQRR